MGRVLAFGIGTSEVEHVMATQTLLQQPAKNMEIRVDGGAGVRLFGQGHRAGDHWQDRTAGGTGHVIEYTGEAILLHMAADVSNMTIEAGARAGLIAPGRDDVRLRQGTRIRTEGRGVGAGAGVLADVADRRGRALRHHCGAARERYRADGDMGHQPGRGGAGDRLGA